VTRRFGLPGVASLLALVFIGWHLSSLAWFPDDIDSVNFALGVRDFDVGSHRPHPPGYPIYIFFGKTVAWLITATGWTTVTPEGLALSLISALAGGLAALPLAIVLLRIEQSPRTALFATVLTLASPLYWFTASRPLSDTPGLAAALVAQALLATAFARQQGWHATDAAGGQRSVDAAALVDTGRLIVAGAFAAGLAVGMRSQSLWLIAPMLAFILVDRAGRGAAGALLGSVITFGFGVLTWLVPMVFATGGPAAYLRALTSQAGQDFEGVDMLILSDRPVRRFALNLWQTFVTPWVDPYLAAFVIVFAIIGTVILLRRPDSRRGLILLTGLFGPYALFHLLFQENAHTRYALPLMVPVAYLAVRGIGTTLGRFSPVIVSGIAVTSLLIVAPALTEYGRSESPAYQMLLDLRRIGARNASAGDPTPVVAMHRQIFTEIRRTREWIGPEQFPWETFDAPRGHEWLEPVKYWLKGGEAPVWFFAVPKRTDLALIAPGPTPPRAYRWAPAARILMGGVRPDIIDWYTFERPDWFLGEGWSLTPETAGIAGQDGKGPATSGSVGYVRRRPDAVRLMIGGRNLGAAGDPVVRFDVFIDQRSIATWDVTPAPGFFLREILLPEGALAGADAFARLTVRAASGDGRPIRASVEQFNLRPLSQLMFGFDTGWHEAEYNPTTGLAWRWSSDASTVRVWPTDRDVVVHLRAESPLRYFDESPTVELRAGTQVLGQIRPEGEISWSVRVDAATLARAEGRLTLTTGRVYVPAEQERRSTDRRRLGLRVFELQVRPADNP